MKSPAEKVLHQGRFHPQPLPPEGVWHCLGVFLAVPTWRGLTASNDRGQECYCTCWGTQDAPQERISQPKKSVVLSLSKPCLSESKIQLLVASQRKTAQESCSQLLQSPQKQIQEDPESSQPEARSKARQPPCAIPYRVPHPALLCSLTSDQRPSWTSGNDGVTTANVTNHLWTPIGPIFCSWA